MKYCNEHKQVSTNTSYYSLLQMYPNFKQKLINLNITQLQKDISSANGNIVAQC